MNRPSPTQVNFAPPAIDVERRLDGVMVLRSPMKLEPYGRCLGDMLVGWASAAPDRLFLAERAGAHDWRKLTYGEVAAAARNIGEALLERGLSAARPVAILSDNGVDHALLMLGAMHVGVPACPISPAYSLMSRDHAKLRYILDLLRPGLIYAADGAKFTGALAALDIADTELVVSANPPAGRQATSFGDLLATRAGPEADAAFAGVRPDTIAKILFTSGSTGEPKGVINTQRMLCSNQQAIAQLWPFLAERPPVIVDWLPWNHTFGANHNFNMMLRHGGALYVDDGKPAPGLVEKTVANLREISPTIYFNVPRGFDMLLPYLESDAALRANFFRHLDLIFYAGAALPQNLWERLEKVSSSARGHRVMMVSAWGSTETAPMVTSVHFDIDRAGNIGLPAPGCELKMVRSAGKLELRVRGPNVTPGYWKRDDLTSEAFDDEGFYRIGDAGRFADPANPVRGIVFDGRLAEDFKLSSGTWVHVGMLRIQAIAACAPAVQDAVITGHDRQNVGMLVFPNLAGCRALCPDAPASATLTELIGRPAVRACVASGLAKLASASDASSRRIARALLMDEPPSIDAGEITDKGYINQRAVLERRTALVERLYAETPDPDVIRPA